MAFIIHIYAYFGNILKKIFPFRPVLHRQTGNFLRQIFFYEHKAAARAPAQAAGYRSS